MPQCVRLAALDVLNTPDPGDKTAKAREVAASWFAGQLGLPVNGAPSLAPDRPARPEKPDLKPPSQVARRRLSSIAGRFALLHAVAHIEFNAVDLAFDLVARFGGSPLIRDVDRHAFISDWIQVGDDEARHFNMINTRLAELGGQYGDLPAHDGLWEAAQSTATDLAARLAIAPMVLEARGLDVTPMMIEKLKSVEDRDSADILTVIYTEEVAHVAAGRRWFEAVCKEKAQDVETTFHELVRRYFSGNLKRPFNVPARDAAGMPQDWYEPLAEMD